MVTIVSIYYKLCVYYLGYHTKYVYYIILGLPLYSKYNIAQRNSTEVCFTYWLQNERRPNSYNLKGIQGRLAAILYWWQRYLIIICKTTPREALLMQCTLYRISFFNNGWCGTHTSGDHPQGCAQGGASGASPPTKIMPGSVSCP